MNLWEHVERCKEDIEDGRCIAIIWHIDDVIQAADDMGKVITDTQAKDILREIDRRHDATIGISWDVLEYFIDSYLTHGGSK